MKKVLSEFSEASPLKKLSTISDIATILGVSVATFVAGPFMSEVAGIGFDASDFIVALFIYSIFILVLIGVFSTLFVSIRVYRVENSVGQAISLFIVFLLFLSVYASSFSHVKAFFGDITNNVYLMPKKAELSIKDISYEVNSLSDKNISIKGYVSLVEGSVATDYVAALYNLDENQGVYYLHSLRNSETFEINKNGDFVIPISKEKLNKGNSYIVIYRDLDSDRFGMYDFPNELTVVPNRELSEKGVFTKRVLGE